MNPFRFLTLFLIGALLCPAALASPRIGVLLKGRNGFWDAVAKGASETGAKLGAEVIVKAPKDETDVSVQIALLRALASQGIQVLIIAPTNQDSLAAPVAALAATGVKIVVMDSPLSGGSGNVFVGTDQRAAGRAAGDLLASLTGDSDEIAIFRHNQMSVASDEREAGTYERLRAAHPGATIDREIYASAEPGAEQERARYLLAQHPGIKGAFASGTAGGMALLHLLQSRGSSPVKFVACGYNLNPEIAAALQSGALSGWVAQLPQDVGAKSVATAMHLLAGEKVSAVVTADFVVVTKDNLSDPQIQALLAL